MDPVHIFVDDAELRGWTEMSLSRNKKDMTGSFSMSLFMNYVPGEPVMVDVTKNKTITVYIGGHLAFTGKVDKRQGSGTKHGATGSDNNERASSADAGGGGRSASISADEYTVKITARGKTKYLVDSSHQHPTTNLMRPTNKEAIQKLIEPWGIDLEWLATDIKLDKIRLRDGGKVVDEIHRICSENGHFVYETRDGKIRVTDDTGRQEGEPLILGQNVLSFSAEQSEENARSKVKVKGQRTEKGIRGAKAVLNVEKEIKDKWVDGDIPYVVQHYGDGTPEALERRANFETNKRSSESKKLTINVFHVQASNGEPWDVGTLHYCEIPPEGIYDVFEVTELTYNVQNDKKISTTLTLSPPPSSTINSGASASGATAAAANAGLSGLAATVSAAAGGLVSAGLAAFAAMRKLAAGVSFTPGTYPAPWSGPDVSVVQTELPQDLAALGGGLLDGLASLADTPKASLPADYQSDRSSPQ